MRRVALVALVLASACGARTGLETPAPDATPRPRFDAGMFTTFPCRWTLGLSTEIARGGDWTELTGAVHPTLDQAAVLALDASSLERRGAIVSIAAAGGVVRPLGPAGALHGPLFTSVTGYARQVDCATFLHDASFTSTVGASWEGMDCRLTQSEVGRVESVSGAGQVLTIRGLGDTFEARPIAELRGASGAAFAFFDDASSTTLVARLVGDSLVLERHLASGEVEDYERSTRASRLSAAPDSLRGGMMVHYLDATDGWRLEHLDWEATRPPEDHFDVSDLPEPAGPIATNETEILIPLVDGRIAYVPFALVSLMVRWVEPVDPSPVEAMHIVLRPNGSAGGVLYQSAGALRFQPLVCNR